MKFSEVLKKVFINRDYSFLWVGQAVSIFGNFFMFLALPIMTYNITGSMTSLSLTILLQAIPAIVAGPFAGALADRWDRKKTMYISDIIRGLLLIPIIIAQGMERLYVIYAVSFLLSLVGMFFNPAYSASTPRIAGKENILKANSIMETTNSIIKILGPLTGALILTTIGSLYLIAIDIFSFTVSAVTIILIRTDLKMKRSEEKVSLKELTMDIMDGIRYIMKWKAVKSITVAFLFISFFQGVIGVLMLPYLKDILKAGEQGYGYAIAAQGVGQVLGSLIIGIAGKKISTEKLFILCVGGFSILLIPYVNLNSIIALLPVLCLIGIGVVGFFISSNTIIQSTVEDKFLGRVENSLNMIFQAGMLITTLITGLLSEIYGIRFVLNIGASIEIIGAILAISILLRKKKVKKVISQTEECQ